jgi:hypothetical protein
MRNQSSSFHIRPGEKTAPGCHFVHSSWLTPAWCAYLERRPPKRPTLRRGGNHFVHYSGAHQPVSVLILAAADVADSITMGRHHPRLSPPDEPFRLRRAHKDLDGEHRLVCRQRCQRSERTSIPGRQVGPAPPPSIEAFTCVEATTGWSSEPAILTYLHRHFHVFTWRRMAATMEAFRPSRSSSQPPFCAGERVQSISD